MDLFAHNDAPGQSIEAPPSGPGTVSLAQKVMDDNTTQLDTQHELDKKREDKIDRNNERNGDGGERGVSDEEDKEDKSFRKNFLSRFKRSKSKNNS